MADEKKADVKRSDSKKSPKTNVKKKKPNVFQKIWKYLVACKGELKKITWPTVSQTTKNFGIVIAVIIVLGLFIFGLDTGLYALLGLVMGTGSAA